MSAREIRVIGDPVLRTVCDPIREITEGVRALAANLIDTVDMEGRAGVAANQIGVSLRAFSWSLDDRAPEDRLGCILNPVITELSDDLIEGEDEGCLSVPGLWFPRTRARFARCEGIDVEGEELVLEGEGLVARLIQHEVGHLDGALYIDGLERPVRKRALREIRQRL
ncbi:peptide deformylase [Brachybacterium sp. JHP9]|uniref:Peptide deformylase n=1 Tax=Brachybacterium equifaecis TaxID=2910770 RepID=A0ABT0R4W5_9MICO|nr:peptide deformylase [Brachybacterium equifaecis]MCL6424463.1 peptide deformylase [Brachybacterium equifaecis]